MFYYIAYRIIRCNYEMRNIKNDTKAIPNLSKECYTFGSNKERDPDETLEKEEENSDTQVEIQAGIENRKVNDANNENNDGGYNKEQNDSENFQLLLDDNSSDPPSSSKDGQTEIIKEWITDLVYKLPPPDGWQNAYDPNLWGQQKGMYYRWRKVLIPDFGPPLNRKRFEPTGGPWHDYMDSLSRFLIPVTPIYPEEIKIRTPKK